MAGAGDRMSFKVSLNPSKCVMTCDYSGSVSKELGPGLVSLCHLVFQVPLVMFI